MPGGNKLYRAKFIFYEKRRLENSHYAAAIKGGCNGTYFMKYSNIQKLIDIQIGYLESKRQNQVVSYDFFFKSVLSYPAPNQMGLQKQRNYKFTSKYFLLAC